MIKNLQVGSRITVLKPMDLVPTRVFGTLQGYYISSYAQYKNALYLFIKPYRARKTMRITILPDDTAFIFSGNFKEAWRKELIRESKEATVSQLHRITFNDVKDNKDLIYYHEYGQEIEGNLNFDMFADCTSDYMCNNNIRNFEALENEDYIEYIKRLLTLYNVNTMLECCKLEGYSILENCIKKAISYSW